MLCDARRPAPRPGTPAVVPGVGSVGHVVRRRLDAATIGAVPPRGAARRQPAESTVDRMISGPQWTPGSSAVPPDGPPTLPGCRTCRAGSSSRRVLRTGRVAQPPSGRHGPRTARRSVCRAAHLVGPARPTVARDRRAVLSGGPARDRRAVLPPWDGAALTGRPAVAGRVRPHTAVPSHPRADGPAPDRLRRPLRAVRPETPCRPIPVGRHGPGPAFRCGGPARDRRAVLSPWAARLPTRPPPPLRVDRPQDRRVVPAPVGTAGRQARRAVPCGSRGLDSRVALGGGRRATRPELPRRSPTRGRRGPDRRAVPPRGRHGLLGRAGPGGWRRPGPCRPLVGEEGDTASTVVSLAHRRATRRGTTVPSAVHPRTARCPPQRCAPGRIPQALTKWCRRAVTLDTCSG